LESLPEQNRVDIHGAALAKLRALHEELVSGAVALLKADIASPDCDERGSERDCYMLRANQICIALMEAESPLLAMQLYTLLIDTALRFRRETGQWRHVGALLANRAAAWAQMGRYDLAAVDLLRAAHEDVHTSGGDERDSFARTHLLQRYFGEPARKAACDLGQHVDPSLALSDIDNLCASLGEQQYALWGYVLAAATHIAVIRGFPNPYSQQEIWGALRSLSSLMELRLKMMTGDFDDALYPALKRLYSGASWWVSFEYARSSIGATQKNRVPHEKQFQQAESLNAPDVASSSWRSLLIAYVVRNYTVHDMDDGGSFVQQHAEDALGHTLRVMILAARYTGTRYDATGTAPSAPGP
jgi:hypothetical protein